MKAEFTFKIAAGYTTRHEQFEGRDHLVVPVVALVQGVIHASNAKNAEFVPEASLRAWGWDGRPVFAAEGHPVLNGENVSGNIPVVLERKRVGTVFNAQVKNGKLLMEAWIDVERANNVDPSILERIADDADIEVSVGVFVETNDKAGTYDGKKYLGEWQDIVPDHLALLPAGDKGACSRKMGCGVRAAKGAIMVEWFEDGSEELIKTLGDYVVLDRSALTDADFAGPNRSFPIADPKDVASAASALGRAKGDRAGIKRAIISIAYKKGDTFVAALPDDWKKKSDSSKNASAFARLVDLAKRAFRGAQDANEMSGNDLRSKLYAAIQEKESSLLGVDDFFPVTDPTHVVYTVYEPSSATGPEMSMGYSYCQYERSFTLDSNGVVTVSDAKIEVVPVVRYEPAEGAEPTTLTENVDKITGAGAPCSCGGHAPAKSEAEMTKEQIEAFLKTATPEQLKALSAVAEGKEPEVVVVPAVVEPKVETPVVAAEVKPVTFAEVLATADPATRDAIQTGRRLGEEKKAATIKALKDTGRCSFSDADLAGMGQAQLDQLVSLAGSNVRAAVDFSVNAPKDLVGKPEDKAVAPPPNLAERIAAAKK